MNLIFILVFFSLFPITIVIFYSHKIKYHKKDFSDTGNNCLHTRGKCTDHI